MVLWLPGLRANAPAPIKLQWLGRWRPLIGIVIIGGALSCLAFVLARQIDFKRIHSSLEFRSQWRAQDLQAKITAATAPVEAVATFVASSEDFTPDQFHRLSARTRTDGDATRVFTWAPYIAGDNRKAFEHNATIDGQGPLTISDRGKDGSVVPAGERDVYLPIWLEERGASSKGVLRGIDILSEPNRRRTFEQALQTGRPTANPPLKSLTNQMDGPRYLVLWPVYSGDGIPATPEERRNLLRGVVVGGADFLTMMTRAIQDTPKIIEDIVISIDGLAAGGSRPIAFYDAQSGQFRVAGPSGGEQMVEADTLVIERQFEVLGRQWSLQFQFPQEIVGQLRSPGPWLWLISGLFLTLLTAGYVDRERQIRMRVEETVDERTDELSASNSSLSYEIGERKRAEEALLHHANLLGKTLEASPLAIVHLGADREVLVWNRGAENMFGFNAAELIGKPYPLLTDTDELPFQELIDTLRAGTIVRDRPVDRRHKDGRIIKVNTSAEAVFENGEFQGIVIVLEDMTQRHALEAQLRQSQKMEAVGQLTGGLAHDFNNLLLVILGNLGLMTETRPNDKEIMEIAGEARDAALRGADLIRSLLAFSRRQPLSPERIDINALLTNQLTLLSRTLGERVEVALDLAPVLWPVLVDGAQLEAAMVNLATNARDAMPKGGKLTIATRNRRLDRDYAANHPEVIPGDHAMIEVSDNGIGMSPEVVSKIFEPFFTTKQRGEGTGLGLSMVFGFMKQSGGHINVYSEVGVGTTFRLFLRRSREAAVVEEEVAAPVLVPGGQGEMVLLVEDNEMIRRLALRQLAKLGYRAHEVDNVADALTFLESGEHVDLLFTDVVMPGQADGLDLVRIVRERWPTVKVLLTSGFPNAAAFAEDTASLGVKLLSKPYQREELARALRETLDGNS